MSSAGSTAVPSFAFGDLGSGLWGVCWNAARQPATVVLGHGNAVQHADGALQAGSVEDAWSVDLGDARLTLDPVGRAVSEGDEPAAGLDQLCRARGRLRLAVGDAEVDCLGWRRSGAAPADLEWSSLRQLAAWFGADDGLALTALRPAAAAQHDRDVLSAAVLGDEHATAVEEPRLSTTYSADGRPRGAGVELWLPGPEGETDEVYPVRAIGEAVGPAATWSQDGITVRAELFRWHSRGREGAGIYLLGRRS